MNQRVMDEILNLGIQLSAERDYDKLLSKIIDCAMDITNSDAGTLYMYVDDVLQFAVMKNRSMHINQTIKDDKLYPPVPMDEKNVCAYAAIHREIMNIPDVYESEEFDFSGPGKYDKMTGYRTTSMLVYPLLNHEGNLVGVVQLINALDENGKAVAYDREIELAAQALAAQGAVALSNMMYMQEIEQLMISITQAFTDAIDTRTPYNYYHSRNVYLYTEVVINHINELHERGECAHYFGYNEKKELLMAALMHDIGKLVVPAEVIDKSTRLGERLELVQQRFDYLITLYHVDYCERRIDKEEWIAIKNELLTAKAKIEEINRSGHLSEEQQAFVKAMSERAYMDSMGAYIKYLTLEEAEVLSVREGNLTRRERDIIQSHVLYTVRYLNKMNFGKRYPHIVDWAGKHHELLNGSGYPDGLKGEEIPFEARILTVVDIYEALTSADRPYKKSIENEQAFGILQRMAKEGKQDEEVITLFEEAMGKRGCDMRFTAENQQETNA